MCVFVYMCERVYVDECMSVCGEMFDRWKTKNVFLTLVIRSDLTVSFWVLKYNVVKGSFRRECVCYCLLVLKQTDKTN